ncbi:hypothetical protein WJX73_001685 [Symbiochloris irregularis]|uniref:Triosephosphate isomerase n=1 Tax=Symbiochloris irregularis TaxID=706552 RepID=A0AAW1NQX1_9CHLO
MARRFFIGGNWKCNGTLKSIEDLLSTLNGADLAKPLPEVVVAPTYVHLAWVKSKLREDFAVAAQNSWIKGSGAYTGEISPEILKDLGIPWVILGHSERRTLCSESSQVVADKTKYALDKGLAVILCVGETLEQREAGKTFDTVAEQLKPVAGALSSWTAVVVAYEPVWAIGTGKVATPEQAQEVHAYIRSWLTDNVSPEVSDTTRLIYGGSVTAKNSAELGSAKDIDGFLVGGASLKPDFVEIIKSAPQA